MTQKQAFELGFDIDKIGRVWHGATETEFKLTAPLRNTKPHELIYEFCRVVFDSGTNYGKAVKIIEIQNALKLPDNFSPFLKLIYAHRK